MVRPPAPHDLHESEMLLLNLALSGVADTPIVLLKVFALPAETFVLCRTRTALIDETRLGALH